MLAKQLPSGVPRHQLIEKVVKQTFRASEIVNNLLNFSRTGALEFTEVNLNSVVEETLSLIAHPLKTAHVRVTRNLQRELPPVLGSNNKLQQVFLNLFMNARDAMPTGGMVEVRTASNKEHSGKVDVRSTPDKGTSFRLEFPAARKAVHV
jgi:signal transduction histidine kinase